MVPATGVQSVTLNDQLPHHLRAVGLVACRDRMRAGRAARARDAVERTLLGEMPRRSAMD